MNKYFKLLALACITLISTVVSAQNKTISIQSTLKNISGEAVPDGNQSLTFKLYSTETGVTALWTETATVEVISGIYSHELGSVTALIPANFGSQLYLGVTINGKELAPRTKLGYAPYAYAVASISGNGQSASFNSSGVFTVSQNQTIAGTLTVSGNLTASQNQTVGNILTVTNNIIGNENLHIDNHAAIGFDGGTAPAEPVYDLTIGDTDTGINHISTAPDELKIMTGGSTNATFKKTTLDELITIFSGRASFGTSSIPDKTVTLAVGDANTGLTGKSDTLEFITGGIERMRIMPNGRVGIGTSSPTTRFNVSNDNAITLPDGTSTSSTWMSYIKAAGNHYLSADGVYWKNSSHTYNDVIAYFEGNTASSNSFISGTNMTFSDQRIKHNFEKSNAKNDLRLLNKIEITEYDHIDKINQDNRTQKKVIAQQVQEVLPNAVTKMRKVIPNVYALADKVQNQNGLMTITTPKAHDFLVGDKIDLKTDKKDIDEVEVVSVINQHTFSVKSDVTTEKVFVYGKYVDDFLTVDYDAVSMLNVSATQELYRMVVDLQKANDNLLKENKSLKESAISIEQRLSLLEQVLTSSNNQNTTSSTASDKK